MLAVSVILGFVQHPAFKDSTHWKITTLMIQIDKKLMLSGEVYMADQGNRQEVVLVCKDFIMWTHNEQFRISLNSNLLCKVHTKTKLGLLLVFLVTGGNLFSKNGHQKALFKLSTGAVLFDIKNNPRVSNESLLNVLLSFANHRDTEHHMKNCLAVLTKKFIFLIKKIRLFFNILPI